MIALAIDVIAIVATTATSTRTVTTASVITSIVASTNYFCAATILVTPLMRYSLFGSLQGLGTSLDKCALGINGSAATTLRCSDIGCRCHVPVNRVARYLNLQAREAERTASNYSIQCIFSSSKS